MHIGRNMDDSFVVWKYVRPVDSVRAVVTYQGQEQGLEPQGQGQAKGLAFKDKIRTKDHSFLLKDNQGPRRRTTALKLFI